MALGELAAAPGALLLGLFGWFSVVGAAGVEGAGMGGRGGGVGRRLVGAAGPHRD